MSFTMVKKELVIIHMLCVITVCATAKPIEVVKEFSINEAAKKGVIKHDSTKDPLTQTKTDNTFTKSFPEEGRNNENSKDKADDLMYTESDLEEAVSQELEGPATKDREIKSNNIENGLTDDQQLLDIYTESDLDETKSEDNVKEKDKQSTDSDLYVPHHRRKRDVVDYTEDGSGDGSGDSPPPV